MITDTYSNYQSNSHQGDSITLGIIPFEKISVPSIEASLLPSWAGEYAGQLASSIQVPDELAISAVLGVVSTAVARKFRIEVKPGYEEPLNLYQLAALESGERKSPTLAKAKEPLMDWEERKARELSPVIEQAKSDSKTAEKEVETLRARAAKEKYLSEREKINTQIREIEKNTPKIPNIPRLLADDITPERAAGIMAENDERIGILSAEGGIFETLGGRYSNNIPNFDLFLKGHCGDSVHVDRKSSNPIFLRNPAITMCISPQPAVLRALASRPEFRGRGLLARFFYYLPQSRLGYRSLDTSPISQTAEDAYHRGIQTLLDYPWNKDAHGEKVPHILQLSEQAYESWREFSEKVEEHLRPGGQFEPVKDWAGKLPGGAARLAGIFHLINHAGTSIPSLVGPDMMERALDMSTLLTQHARAAFGLMGADAAIETAKHILEWIERRKLEEFSQRDCHYALQGRYPKIENITPGLKILQERYYIAPISVEYQGRGRPKSPVYVVNPRLYERRAA
jgi:putative DNA primase/helicase